MEFNDKWTKAVNDEYRQMIKEHRTTDEILEYFGDLMSYHPDKKYSHNLYTHEKFLCLLKEISFHPNYISFGFNYYKSIRFPDKKDIFCFFDINGVEYILILEYLIENNSSFKNTIVYNIFFTTKEQYERFKKMTDKLLPEETENMFSELKNIVEKETNKHDTIKIFNAISYILLKIKKELENNIYMIGDTDNSKKINFYKTSIEESFSNKYDLVIDESIYLPGRKSYYYILK